MDIRIRYLLTARIDSIDVQLTDRQRHLVFFTDVQDDITSPYRFIAVDFPSLISVNRFADVSASDETFPLKIVSVKTIAGSNGEL